MENLMPLVFLLSGSLTLVVGMAIGYRDRQRLGPGPTLPPDGPHAQTTVGMAGPS